MGERGFEAIFRPHVREFYDQQSAADRAEIDRIREAIEANPDPDGERKVVLQIAPDSFLTAYRHPRWWLLYFIPEPGRGVIDLITPRDPSPWFAR